MHLANADTGTTGNYMSFTDSAVFLDLQPTCNAITVTLPDGTHVTSTHTARLDLPCLPLAARRVDVFPGFIGSLLSTGVLCDHGLIAIYTASHVHFLDPNGTLVLQGVRSPVTKLWLVDLASPTVPTAPPPLFPLSPPDFVSAAVITEACGTQQEIVDYYIATMGSCAASTLIAALDDKYIQLPGLTSAMIRKYPPTAIAIAKGHLDQLRQGLRTTKLLDVLPETTSDLRPVVTPRSSRYESVLTKVVYQSPPTSIRHTDLTGKFPVTALSGACYHLVMLCGNYIHVEAMKSRQSSDYVAAYRAGDLFFKAAGILPLFERLDNETSALLVKFIGDEAKTTIQYLPAGNHRASKAERAIRTWKNHFVAILSATDPSFPLHAWEHLLPQAELTINLLRASSFTPNTSAWQALHGAYIFDRTPIAPPGMKILCFEPPDKRSTWAPHGVPGYYVGPALHHHRCFTVFLPDTASTRITGALSWHPPPTYTLPGAGTSANLLSSIIRLRHSFDLLRSNPAADPTLREPLDAASPAVTSALDALQAIFQTPQTSDLPSVPSFLPVVPPLPDHPRILPPPSSLPDIAVPAPVVPQRVASDASADSVLAAAPPVISDVSSTLSPPLTFPLGKYRAIAREFQSAAPLPRASVLPRYTAAAASMSDAFATDVHNKPLTHRATFLSPDAALWRLEDSKELSRLLHDTQTMHFIDPRLKPADRLASYYNPQVQVKLKDGVIVRRTRGTYGGNLSDFSGDCSSYTADLQTVKLHFNAIVSESAHHLTLDLKDFYLGSTLPRPEYMWLTRSQLPADIQQQYAADIVWHGDRALVEVTKGIYGLAQAGKLAQDDLFPLLASGGYHQCPNTPLLFKHATRPISFVLVVDDFSVKYTEHSDALHLLATLGRKYEYTVDWAGSKFLGMTVQYDRSRHALTLSMPGYVQAAMRRFDVQRKPKPTHSPALFVAPAYGAKTQYAAHDDSAPTSPAQTKYIQEVIGTFLYYARAIDSTMIPTLSKLASRQSVPTVSLYADVQHFLQYAATYPDAEVTYYPSDMRLIIWSDASYLSESKARSRAGGLHYLSSAGDPATAPINGAIDVISVILPTVVSAASEAEYAGLFHNGQAAVSTINTLADLGYPQSATPIITDNTTAVGIANHTVRLKRSKAMDMRYHWIRDRVRQGYYQVTWGPGELNLADYFTKTHPSHHYRTMRSKFVGDAHPFVLPVARPRRAL